MSDFPALGEPKTESIRRTGSRNMSGKTKRWGLPLAVALLLLFALPALSLPASASPAAPMATSASSGAPVQWAYGGEGWTNVTVTTNNATYHLSAFLGWAVIFTQTNTSNGVMIEAQRAMGVHLDAAICIPDCTTPTANVSMHYKGFEKETAFANFTYAGSVYVNGTPTAAIALTNTSVTLFGALNESYYVTVTNQSSGVTLTSSASLKVGAGAAAEVSFKPALGLVPLNATVGERWNSTSNASGSGYWYAHYAWVHNPFIGGSTQGSGHAGGTVNGSAIVQLAGTDAGLVTLNNGATVPVIVLVVTGPFDDLDGFVLVPHGGSIFGAGLQAWSTFSVAAEIVNTAHVDFDFRAKAHVGFTAAASSYEGTAAAVSLAVVTTLGTSTAASPAAGTSPAIVQAQPESVPAAQQQQNCYETGCPANLTHGFSTILLIVLLGLVLAAIVGAAYVIGGRRGPQAPRSPVTIPAGALGVPPKVVPPSPPRPSNPNVPPPDRDPLDHVW